MTYYFAMETGDISEDDWSGVFTQENPVVEVKERSSVLPDIGINADGIPFFLVARKRKKRKKVRNNNKDNKVKKDRIGGKKAKGKFK